VPEFKQRVLEKRQGAGLMAHVLHGHGWFVSWVLWTLVMWVALWLYIAWFLSIQRYKPF
jgi:hypothetical protein